MEVHMAAGSTVSGRLLASKYKLFATSLGFPLNFVYAQTLGKSGDSGRVL